MNYVTSKQAKKILSDPRVAGLAEEEANNGAWAYLKPGYQRLDDPGVHDIHEETGADILRALKNVGPCTCQSCRSHGWGPIVVDK